MRETKVCITPSENGDTAIQTIMGFVVVYFCFLGLPVEENASEKSEEEADQQEPEEDESK